MAQRDFTVRGKQHQVDGVDDDLKRKHHIKGERLDKDKLKVEVKDEKEVQAVIEAVHKNNARLDK